MNAHKTIEVVSTNSALTGRFIDHEKHGRIKLSKPATGIVLAVDGAAGREYSHDTGGVWHIVNTSKTGRKLLACVSESCANRGAWAKENSLESFTVSGNIVEEA